MADELIYDQLAAQRASAPGAAPAEEPSIYDALAQQQAQQREAALRATLSKSVLTSPDQAAKTHQLSQDSGIPFDVVERNQDQVERQQRIRQNLQLMQASPVLRQQMLDPVFAKLAHDDTAGLSAMEKMGKSYLGSSLKSGYYNLMGTGALLLSEAGSWLGMGVTEAEALDRFKNDPQKFREFMLDSPATFLPRFAAAMQDASGESMRNMSDSAKAEYGAKEYATTDAGKSAFLSPTKMAGDVLQQVPQMLALIVASRSGVRGAAGAYESAIARGATEAEARTAAIQAAGQSAATTSAASEGAVGYAQQYNQTLQDIGNMPIEKLQQNSAVFRQLIADGIDPEVARRLVATTTAKQAALVSAYVDSLVNYAGGKYLGEIIGEGGKVMPRVGKGFATESITEGIQSAWEQLGQNLATQQNADSTLPTMQGVLESVLQGATIGGLMGGGVAGIFGSAQKQEHAQLAADQVKQLMDTAAQLGLREHAPDTFEGFLQQVTDNKVYVDGRVLEEVLNSDEGRTLMAKVPEISEQIADAVATGGTVEIPLSKLVTYASGTSLQQPLLDNLRTDPDALSVSEAQAEAEQTQELMQKRAQEFIEQSANKGEMELSADRVKQNFLDQLNTAKRFTPDVNEAYANLMRSFYTVLGGTLNVTPEQAYQQFPYRVVSGLDTQGSVLSEQRFDQNGKLGTWYGADSTLRDADGKPMVLYHGTTTKGESGIKASRTMKRSEIGAMGSAIYLGDSPEASAGYDQGAMLKVYARGKYLTNAQWTEYVNKHGWKGAEAAAKADGWAGVYDTKFENAVAVWDADNIKSVDASDFAETGDMFNQAPNRLQKAYLAGRDAAALNAEERQQYDMLATPNGARPAESVAPRSPHPGDTPMYEAMRQLSRFEDSFQAGFSEAKDLAQIAQDLTAGRNVQEFTVEKSSELHQGNRKPTLALKVKTANGNEVKLLDIFDAESDKPFVVIGNSEAGQAAGGATAYQIAFAWAHNNGKTMRPDPAGLTVINRLRRTEAMISSALRFGTTKHLEPHQDQYVALLQRVRDGGTEPEDTHYSSRPDIYGELEQLKQKLWDAGAEPATIATNVQHLLEASGQLAALREPAIRNFEVADGVLRVRDGRESEVSLADLPADKDTGEVNILGVVLKPATSGVGASTLRRAAVSASVARNLARGVDADNLQSQDRGGQSADVAALQAIRQVLGRLDSGTPQDLTGALYQLAKDATDTPAFKNWFGDSKVVDAEGKPLVVYHGTMADFDKFDDGTGWFSTDPGEANMYGGFNSRGANVMPTYLSIKNPVVLNASDTSKDRIFDALAGLRKDQDGVLVKEGDAIRWAIVANPEQIKSAIGNNGNFDPKNPSILEQGGVRGTFNPSTLTTTLLADADLSTFLHETGHFFLEVVSHVASQPNPPARMAEDMGALLKWFGITGAEKGPSFNAQLAFEKFGGAGDVDESTDIRAKSLALSEMAEKLGYTVSEPGAKYLTLKKHLGVDADGYPKDVVVKVRISDHSNVNRGVHFDSVDINIAPDDGYTRDTFDDALIKLSNATVDEDLNTVFVQGSKTPLEVWRNMPLDQQRPYHERFAESFEQYLFEGKAPSKDLQPLFQRFRQFLLGVYKSLKHFAMGHDTQLNDEVRAVFDRLLATDEEINAAQQEMQYAALFDSKPAGMSDEDWAKYIAKNAQATADAAENLQARSLRDARWVVNARGKMLKSISKDVEAKRKAVREEVTAEVDAMPTYAAWAELKSKEGPKLSTASLEEMYGAGIRGKDFDRYGKLDWKRLVDNRMTSQDGADPDVVAERFGFTSGDEMVNAMLNAEPRDSMIEGMTDQRLLERYGDLVTPQGIERAALEAVHNEARARFLATEMRALEEGMSTRQPTGKVDKKGRAITENVLLKSAKNFAEQVIARRKVRDLRPGQYTAAEKRAAKRAAEATKAGKTQEAIAAKQDQLLNFETGKAAMAAQDEIERGLKRLQKIADSDSIPPEYKDQIDKMLERFDLRTSTTLKEIDKRASLLEWVESQRDLGIEPDIPPELLNEAQRLSYKELTVEQFRGLLDTVRQIEHLGRLKDKLLTAHDKRVFTAIRDQIADSIITLAGDRQADTRTPNTVLGSALQAIKGFGAAHIKAATWARIMDGGKDGGPVWEYLIRTANDAGNKEVVARAKATQELAALVAPVLKEGKLGGKGVFFPGIGRSLNREAVLAIALNTGNESNLQRLLGGEGWTAAQIQPVLASMSENDWHFVQSVWDHFESYRSQIAEKERRVSGKEPEWIEASPREVQTADGKTVKLRGGYYPVKYDPRASERAEAHADAELAKQQIKGAYTSATTRRSFTKSRAEEVTGRPLLYSLDGIYNGVQEVIHDLSWHEYLIDANRLLRDKKISSAMRNKYGPDAHQQFKSWVQDVAQGDQAARNAGERALAWVRQGVSVSGLGFNLMSALIQPLGVTQSITRIGGKWVGKGIAKYIGSPIDTANEINEKSEFMRTRAMTRLRELAEVRTQVKGRSKARQAIDGSAYFMMLRAQQMVDIPTWWGAYEKAIAEGNEESRAVALADQSVIDSQGGGSTKDLSAIERGGPALKLFTTFYSFFNTALNLGVQKTMNSESKAKLAADYALLYVVPVILGALLKDALTAGDSGDWDDPKKAAKRMAGEELSYLFGLMFGLREVGGAAQVATGTNQYGKDYSGPAGLRPITDVYKLAEQVHQGEMDAGLRRSIIRLSGDLLRLPAAQINRSIDGAQALADGKTQNPGAIVTGYQERR